MMFPALRLRYFCVIILLVLGTGTSQAENLRLLHNGHLPQKVLVVLTSATREFVKGLIDIVAEIHQADGLTGKDAFKVHILSSSQKDRKYLKNDAATLKEYAEFNDQLFVNDIWMQDIGELCAIEKNGAWVPGIFDSKRGRGLGDVAPWLAKNWQLEYAANPSTQRSGGDYGGNIEVTPDNILYHGDTMTGECEKFLLQHGYQGRSIKLQTSWLQVGHIDEYLTIIPTHNSPCGYSIVRADPWFALDLLEGATEEDFAPLPTDYQKFLKGVQAALRDPEAWKNTKETDFIELNRKLGEVIEANVGRLVYGIREITGDTDREIPVMEWPTLFHNFDKGRELKQCIAYTPGVANHLVLRGHLVVPDPFFPPFKRTVEARFRAQGNRVHFLNDLTYHKLMGEVHCGTNVLRDPARSFISPAIHATIAAMRDMFDRVHQDRR